MRRLALGSLFVLILSIGFFAPPARASDLSLAMMPHASIATLGKTGHMATGNLDWFWAWLTSTIRTFYSNVSNHHTPNGSVPIPGTLLLFGGGFAGLVVWRARHPRS